MEQVLIKIRLLQVTEDLIKDAFIQRSMFTKRIDKLTLMDIIESYPFDQYDYRADGRHLEYTISTNELNKLFNVAQQNRLQINSIRFEEFEDCVEISNSDGSIVITCKDAALGSIYERVVFLNKQSVRKYVGLTYEYNNPTKSLEELLKQDVVSVDVEAGMELIIYFTVDVAKTPLEDVADAYINILREGTNRTPTASDIVPIALSRGAAYVNAFMQRPQASQLLTANDMEISMDGGIATLSHNSTPLIKLDAKTLDEYLVRVLWADLNLLKINSINYRLINLGIEDVEECSESIVENSLKSYSKASN
ncbi:hypothetical protein GCM10007981_08820 [Thermocladium modestius]|uniref:Uncharacterized protein n=1 Tax=Thermocladium modestius TaxID=62609 RepID=A0A830GT03_9CREN|nr:hypothetical protein [Thermocladium modestius]GGP20497.1 hypothetical protein GCM10007981_08820 [Thermocladium modestius]